VVFVTRYRPLRSQEIRISLESCFLTKFLPRAKILYVCRYVCVCVCFLRFSRHITAELQRPVLFREVIALCSENHIKPFNTLYGSNVACFNVQASDAYSGHHAFKWLILLKQEIHLNCIQKFNSYVTGNDAFPWQVSTDLRSVKK
jgi:hypothetical protein